ncbi:MAG: Cytochrome c-type biogenesis protein DsbD, protein-disulfide reductase (EC [uncultured Sulfurovum sp.]|uniref:Cytochrome c-type biogenesis protein DsbD, protein-disulfide reductase (EC) n=1 Tax=uncultured Sulfurovum sp. TaxID=269237 RepID=A0A6S6SH02_9BACT|nr:MAG: Cytochrome c-type biogenesis protein DsbD, protein-disulfide reductase (EC [uncultured Sulfurovum sp.]
MYNLMKKLLLLSLLFTSFVLGGFGDALKKQKFLSPDEAFSTSAVVKDGNIETKIIMAEKIHIYENSVHYRVIAPEMVELEVEKPKAHDFDGDMVYDKELIVNIPKAYIESKVAGDYTLEIEFQGCSDAGICYQPIKKTFDLKGAELGTFEKISKLAKEGNASKIVDVLINESSFFVLFLFFIFGLLLSLTPCIFPMIPILSSIIVSQQGDNQKPSMGKAFFTSLVYVLAMALTYTIVGLVAGLLGADLQTAMQNPWVLTIFAGVFIALALSLFGYYEIGLPASWQSKISQASDGAQGKGIMGTAIMGALSALIVGPCTAAPISGAVIFISQTGDALLGGAALFVMSMGMGMPLLLVGIGAGKFMPRPGGWMTAVSQVFGVMMLGLAIFMLSRILPGGLTMILWSLLFMGTALYMGVFESKVGEGAMKLFKLLAMVFLVYGIILFVGAVSGANSMFSPLKKFTSGTVVTSTTTTPITNAEGHLGYSVARLMKEVEASDKPVIVDFGKDSCTACVELEEITFPDNRVQEQMQHFTFIKIDLTANNEDDKALLKEYGLFGTPNIIFFDKNNNFMPEQSLTGFIPPEDFAEHLKGIVK